MQALLSMSTVTTPVMDSTYHGKEGAPQKRYAHLLMLGTCDIDLIWKQVFAGIIQLRTLK